MKMSKVTLAGQSFEVPAEEASKLRKDSKAALAVGQSMAQAITDSAAAEAAGVATLRGLHMLLFGSEFVSASTKPKPQNVVTWFHGELLGSCVRDSKLLHCEGASPAELEAAQKTCRMASEWATASRAVVECSPPENLTNRRTLADWYRDAQAVKIDAVAMADKTMSDKKARVRKSLAEKEAARVMSEAAKLAEATQGECSSVQAAEAIQAVIPAGFTKTAEKVAKRITSRDTTAKRTEAAKAPKGTKGALESLRAAFDVLGGGHHGAVSAILVDVLGWKEAAKLAEVLDTACTDAKNG